jgi:cyanophycinase-like exopeptidase
MILPALVLAAAAHCAPTVYTPAGHRNPDRLIGGPGLVLSGGGLSGMPYVEVLRWIRSRIAAPASVRAGNLLILKASGERYYSDLFYARSRLGSVREILIPPCASRPQIDRIALYVHGADAVLFAGGDQAHYVAWKGTRLIDEVKRLYARGGIVGGGSAGLAIQGQVIFDSVAADRVLPDDRDVATADAVKDPYETAISFTTALFSWPALRNTVTDTHFARRNRFGRLAAFMARALRDGLVNGKTIYGVAVDEGAVLAVDARGVATLLEVEKESDGYVPRGAYILKGGSDGVIARGHPLLYKVSVTHITSPHSRYNLVAHKGPGRRYSVTIDGASSAVYSQLPY